MLRFDSNLDLEPAVHVGKKSARSSVVMEIYITLDCYYILFIYMYT